VFDVHKGSIYTFCQNRQFLKISNFNNTQLERTFKDDSNGVKINIQLPERVGKMTQ